MISGAGYLRRGFALWRTRPGLMLLGALPALIVLIVLVTALVALAMNLGDLVSALTPFADDSPEALRVGLRFLLGVLLVAAALMVATLSFTGLTLIVGDPFYEQIWREVELMLGGSVPGHEQGFWASARDSIRLIGVGALTTVLVLVVGLLPVVGTLVGLAVGIFVSGRLLAAELLGRPLSARGLDRAGRRDLLRTHRGPVLGFGIATQALFLVPLGAVVTMPAAVAGATMLAHDLTTYGGIRPTVARAKPSV